MGRLLSELKRRHVYRVAAAYVVLAWVLLQVVNNVAPVLDLPAWIARAFLLALIIGFPIALFFAWIRELPSDSTAPKTATTRLDYILAGALVVVIALISYQQLSSSPGTPAAQQASIALLETIPENGTTPRGRALAQAYAALGQYAKAADAVLSITSGVYSRQELEDVARLLRAAPAKPTEPLPNLDGRGLRFLYVHIGAVDRYLETVEREVQARYIVGLSSLWRPDFAAVRKTERFKALMRKAGLVDYWRARAWPDLCRPVGADDFVCD
jgi:hypothetical protein